MIAELSIVMLACARIGAVHAIVFGGFSAEALRDRINNSGSKVVITCDGTYRGAKAVPQKATCDKAVDQCPRRANHGCCETHWNGSCHEGGPRCLDEALMAKADRYCEPEWMDAEDPLVYSYTSGSTGQPKGVVHTQAGYLLYAP